MKNNKNNNSKETGISTTSPAQSLIRRPRWPKSREVSSRFLSPTSTAASTGSSNIPPPNRVDLGTYKQYSRKHRSLEESSMLFRELWPQSKTDHHHLNNFPDIENATTNNNKSNGRAVARRKKGVIHNDGDNSTVGGSMRFVGELKFSRNRLPSRRESVHSSASDSMNLTPQRSVFDHLDYESESEHSDCCSGMAPSCSSTPRSSSTDTMSFRRLPGEASSSQHANDRSAKTSINGGICSRREMNILNPSGKTSKSSPHNTVKRVNSSKPNGNAPPNTEWALAGRRATPFLASNLPNGASTTKGVGSFITSGSDLFNNNKSMPSASSSSLLSPVKSAAGTETTHRLRLLYNGLIKWRYANAEADATNQNLSNQAQRNILYACDGLRKLQCSVLTKKLQLEKEKREMKLNFIVHSQIDALEAWGHMERQHLAAVSRTKECLHSVVCRVPLIEGSKAEIKSTWSALRHASDLASSAKSLATVFMPQAETAVQSLSELAEVVSMEMSLLPECFEYLRMISQFQLQEGSLRCGLAQANNFQRLHGSNSSNDQVSPAS